MADSPVQPKHEKDVTQAKLWAIYKEHEFADKLSKCNELVFIDRDRKPEDTFHAEQTEHERAVKYVDPVKQYSIAVIFTYTSAAGEKHTTIRMLRVGDVIYDALSRKS